MNLTDSINLLVNRTRPATFGPFGLDRKVFISLMSFDPTNNNSSLTQLDLIYNRNEVTHLAHLEILGPCHGLYCLHSSPILIVNPSMREFRILPDIPAPPKTYCLQRYNGFGFDPKTNDYKEVMIMDTWYLQTHERLPWRVEIYSLNSHCWRNVDFPFPRVFIRGISLVGL
ncbi:hypothetical protein K1719_039784 [Acacia pycnantha]|nr:hypothetical protein K1719_039784 [Acacia pycnantha]